MARLNAKSAGNIRNRLLAECFYATGDIERYGSGFIRIRRALREYPETSLNLLEKGDFFWAELCLTPIKTPIKTPINNLSELEEKILNALRADNTATFQMLAGQLGISRHTVIEYVNKLKGKQIIKRAGSRRSGRWELITQGGDESGGGWEIGNKNGS
jgi:ATP-dependent DNA helicase RecG